MSEVQRLIDDYCARHERSRAWVARGMGINDKTLGSWFTRGRQSPISAPAVKALSRVLELDYRTVLDAALSDAGYLPGSAVVDLRDISRTPIQDAVESDLLGSEALNKEENPSGGAHGAADETA